MSVFHRPMRGRPTGRRAPVSPAGRPAVPVTLAADLADQAGALADALGPDYKVAVGPPGRSGVAVLSPPGTAAIAFYRMCHPDTALLVVDRGVEPGGQSASDYLNCGADGYLSAQPAVVVAAQIQALARRQAIGRVRRPVPAT